MVIFNERELNYIKQNFSKHLKDFQEIKVDEEDIRNFLLEDLTQKEIDNIKYILENFNKINTDEEVNDKVVDTVYWVEGMWVWRDNECNREETSEFISDEIWLDIYEKILKSWGILEEECDEKFLN